MGDGDSTMTMKRKLTLAAATFIMFGTLSVVWDMFGIGGSVWSWVAKAEEHHEDASDQKVEQTEMGKLLKILAEERAEQIAAKNHTALLCRQGKMSSCRACIEAGVYDAKGCK